MSKRQENIKELLRILKKEFGVSQKKIAERIGLSAQQMSYHLNSSSELDKDIYENLLSQINRFGIISDLHSGELKTINEKPTEYNSSNPITEEEKKILELIKAEGYNYQTLSRDLIAIKNIKQLVVEPGDKKEEKEKVKTY